MATDPVPFIIDVPDTALEDLQRRLQSVRWPERETVDDWSQGAPLAAIQSLCDYWRQDYDWARCQQRLNQFPQFTTPIDGLDIHFLHIRSSHPHARPLLLTHGWPGSVLEFAQVIEPLTQPERHGGDPADAFHLVLPSLPGYGFSGKPTRPGWGVEKIARAWDTLMTRLGYPRYFAQGGDWGSAVTATMAALNLPGCRGIHLNLVMYHPQPEDLEQPTEEELAALEKLKFYADWDSGYSKQQSTRPQTIGYGLVDSPVALAAWIYEKFYFWSDHQGLPESTIDRDHLLDNIMIYWLNSAGASAARLYWESFNRFQLGNITVPVGVSQFPQEIFRASRRWAEKHFHNIVYWNQTAKGGHFAAFEQPGIFVAELRDCFRQMD